MSLTIIYIVSGLMLWAMSITMLIAVVRIWQILNEIIASGAIPSVLATRVKRDAKEALRVECVGYNPQRLAKITSALSELKGDREATELLHKLSKLNQST